MAAVWRYRTRLRDLDEELAEASDWADEARLSRLNEEREACSIRLPPRPGSAAGRARTGPAAADRDSSIGAPLML